MSTEVAQPDNTQKNIQRELTLEIDTNYAVEIAEDVYWIGFYDERESLHCNPYMIKNGDSTILIDPGSIPDFPVVARKIFSLVAPDSIETIILQHQDPDLCANVPIFEDLRGDTQVQLVAETRTVYLIKHYGVKGSVVRIGDSLTDFESPSGRKLQFISTPFAHSPGAMITYDVKSKVLFTSDILGGLGKEWALYHDARALDNMKAFMQAYIPSNLALRYALLRIQSFDAEVIAPQHGQIIRKEQLPSIIEELWNLPCGLDLIKDDMIQKARKGDRS
ncbi:MBL fold metallo-hydrolase [Leptospira yasudae]|uniref:Metallo-beta-lactamase domain-containing protein n=1 Tax=Leptospira yasudae TaxID=2202201 RepID=A0ABX9M419_9LEPT|nr:MBL fold metallo-hydrolase [Leptospira yasudae]RHX80008.1 hypothetical protein DLM77_09030 [Leptospira yasudae]TGK25859.1 MBL fold metallo-hydrolase [Leptospira yasudae]TGM02959.1 MBL fold metallo-hydrolase [Leptospira yasudae]